MSLQFLKSFEVYNKLNEDLVPPKKLKFWTDPKNLVQELMKEQGGPAAVDYLNGILAELDALPEADKLSMVMKKIVKSDLSKEDMEKYEQEFKSTDDHITPGKYKYIFYKTVTLAEAAKTDTTLKTKIDELNGQLKVWNDKNEHIFAFANDVGDKVTNVDETKKALTELKDILDKHKEIVCCVTGEFEGHTSTTGDAAHNQTLSEQRANTVKNMFLEVMPEAKTWSIVSLGKGATEPLVTPDDTEDKQKQNRRVEFKINVSTNPAGSTETQTAPAKYTISGYALLLGHKPEYKDVKLPPQHKFKILNKKGKIPCPKVG